MISPYFPGAAGKELLSGIRSLWWFNDLLTLPGKLGYRRIDSLLRRLPSYEFIHGHMINLDPNPLCNESNGVLRERYEGAIKDACVLVKSFLPALRGRRQWPVIMDYNFESEKV